MQFRCLGRWMDTRMDCATCLVNQLRHSACKYLSSMLQLSVSAADNGPVSEPNFRASNIHLRMTYEAWWQYQWTKGPGCKKIHDFFVEQNRISTYFNHVGSFSGLHSSCQPAVNDGCLPPSGFGWKLRPKPLAHVGVAKRGVAMHWTPLDSWGSVASTTHHGPSLKQGRYARIRASKQAGKQLITRDSGAGRHLSLFVPYRIDLHGRFLWA